MLNTWFKTNLMSNLLNQILTSAKLKPITVTRKELVPTLTEVLHAVAILDTREMVLFVQVRKEYDTSLKNITKKKSINT